MIRSFPLYRFLEFLILFIGLPSVLLLTDSYVFMLALLWVVACLCFLYLWRDPSFDRSQLWGHHPFQWEMWRPILARLAMSAAVLTAYCWWFERPYFLSLLLERPNIWMIVMMLYPVISAFPQEVVFRSFFMHRYRSLFKRKEVMIAVNGLAFGYAHVFFDNGIAVFLSTIGGFIFAYSYYKQRSLASVSLEHALYGNLIFTLGLGWYFWGGAPG